MNNLRSTLNLNGDVPRRMIDDCLAVSKAAAILQTQLGNLCGGACHGRNYQTNADPVGDREADAANIEIMMAEVEVLRAWAIAQALRFAKMDGK